MASDPVRDEAERLVATAIAAVSLAARGLGAAAPRFGGAQGGFATGSIECCVCPVCRLISAMRDPSPDLAERLATGAGDLASALTGIMRTLGRAGAPEPEPASRGGDEFWDSLRRRAQQSEAGEDPWHTATTATIADEVDGATGRQAGYDGRPAQAGTPTPMARKAVKKAAPASSAEAPPSPAAPAAGKTVKKAVKKAAGSADSPPVDSKAAKKAIKKAAKKATKKATRPPGAA